jgi:glycosyltransferase involved in cell wall biosynthesis
LIPKKRVRDFICALQQAVNSGAAVEGLVVGDGPLRSECETLVSSSGVPVRFAGFLNQSEIVKAYIAADMLVLPSDGGETWGLVVNEAMCCGRPCIVSDQVGCGPDLVQPGKTGAIFPLGDVDALAKLMVSFAGDEKLMQQMGVCCRQLMRDCSVQTAVDGVVAALAALQTGA